MRLPSSGGKELTAAIRRYVTPGTGQAKRYLMLLHGNFVGLHDRERTRFLKRLGRSACRVSDHELTLLLDGGWRCRLTASWLIALSMREQFRDQLGELLLASEAAFAGQGYCLALARFATAADADILAAYLDCYLPQLDKRYDQDWALGALVHLDTVLGTSRAAPFIADGGPWQQWRTTEETPADLHAWIDRLCSAADEAMRGETDPPVR